MLLDRVIDTAVRLHVNNVWTSGVDWCSRGRIERLACPGKLGLVMETSKHQLGQVPAAQEQDATFYTLSRALSVFPSVP
jgi:hypothetical protein